MIDLGRRSVLGVSVSAVDREAVVRRVIDAAKSRTPLGVSALAVHGLMLAYSDPELLLRINRLAIVAPDGQPVRWALNLLYRVGLRERVYGPDLTLDVCEHARDVGVSVFLFGSTHDVLQRLESNLKRRFRGLKLAGSQASRFRPATEEEVLADRQSIVDSGADIVLVGLGCPRQEVWVYENVEELSMPALAVGAAFDYHSGVLAEPPAWMQRVGLQWLYRLAQEPRRLWRRYVLLNPVYLILVALQATRLRRFPVRDTGADVPTLRPS